jgi:oligoribonuclease (3'-5' exoribonuclease)
MPKLDAYFHYRCVDVSTLKELALRWQPEVVKLFKKKQRHTALADVHESIDELAHYRRYFRLAPLESVSEVASETAVAASPNDSSTLS